MIVSRLKKSIVNTFVSGLRKSIVNTFLSVMYMYVSVYHRSNANLLTKIGVTKNYQDTYQMVFFFLDNYQDTKNHDSTVRYDLYQNI